MIDFTVNLAAALTRFASRVVRLHDESVVDGAVAGAGRFASGLGAVARAVQSGYVRSYVTMLMLALAVGLVLGLALLMR